MSSFFLPFAWAQSAATTFGGDVTLDFEAAVPESTSKAYEGMIMSIGDQYIPSLDPLLRSVLFFLVSNHPKSTALPKNYELG